MYSPLDRCIGPRHPDHTASWALWSWALGPMAASGHWCRSGSGTHVRSLGWAEQEEQQFDRTLGLDEIFAYPGLGCTVVPRGPLPSVLCGSVFLRPYPGCSTYHTRTP